MLEYVVFRLREETAWSSCIARKRLRVLSLLSKGGTSVPVGSAADENRHFEEAERENYHRHGSRARATFAAHGNNCISS
jgi:hypothetical protein